MKKTLLIALTCHCCLLAAAQIAWPPVAQETKPWARWWWQGSAVNEKDITRSLEQYRAAGLGGLEITPIYGVQGAEQQFVRFLSPRWMQLLVYTLREARRLGLGIDMANGTGWPFGGPWITEGEASKTVAYQTYTLNGGEELQAPVTYREEGFVRTANNRPLKPADLLQPVRANPNLQALALDQVRFGGQLPLRLLMAYSDAGAAEDLTARVDTAGRLQWKAPAGRWTLYALFEGLHGKMVERAAPGGEGYAIDHFSAEALQVFLRKFDTAFRGHDLSYLRALFNDSYEVDDARGQSNWTPGLLAEFRRRRGYDLRLHLPALFGKDTPEKNSRVLYDYRATIDELILEYFTRAWKAWGTSKGALIRNQSHGSPANLLDLYGAIDIPETEGTDILRFKFATSAAHVLGKKLASSESATWLNEHFLSSWGDVKKILDLFFLGGVNHIFYHGVNYSPQEAPWPGWLFYAAVHFHPSNPQWKDFGALNSYVSRVQSFLQQGQPDNDLLLYYPLADRYADPGRDLLQHFDGMERQFEGTDFEHVSRTMVDEGYTFDFFSDRQLQGFTADGARLRTGGNGYAAILLPANRLVPGESFEKLFDLARKGASILVYKNLPADVPGYARLDERRAAFRRLVDGLQFREEWGVRKAVVGKGAFYVSDNLHRLLRAGGVRQEPMADGGLSFVRRKYLGGTTYFICNRTDSAIYRWVPLTVTDRSAALYDPMTGGKGLARWRRNASGHLEVLLQLQPHASVLVQTFPTVNPGAAFPLVRPFGQAYTLRDNWQLTFVSGGPVLPPPVEGAPLGSWTELPGEEVKNFSGTARYRTSFPRPGRKADAWQLDLGAVYATAEVFLNGQKLATLVGPRYTVVVPEARLQATNTLEVVVSNLMANRIAYMDRNGLPWKKFYNINMSARIRENVKNGVFDASGWKPLPSGLVGPVTLTPMLYDASGPQ